MKTWPRRLAFLSLAVLLVAPSAALPAPAHARQDGPRLMPPNPRLLEEYKAGRLPMPDFVANPALLRAKGIDSPAEPVSLLGSLKALAVVVDFSDKVHTVTASFFDSLIFAPPVAGRGSVRDYFNEVSYSQIDIVTVNLPSSMGWVRAPSSYATYVDGDYCLGYYPNNCQKLAEDIVDAINSVVNFANYDNNHDGVAEPIMLIHAGPGAEFTGSTNDVWSHSASLKYPRSYDGVTINHYVIMPEYWLAVSPSTSDMTIGVFAHEMGHGFWGLPDLYDRDYSSAGIGLWSVMAGGSWNGGTIAGGDSPAWPDAWCRVQMGIVTPTSISSNASGRSIPRAYNNPPPAQTVLKLASAALGPSEYYLLENRQRLSGSYDEYLLGQGLLIWHVDEAMWSYTLWNDYECVSQPNYTCSDAQHYLVALHQADGRLDLEQFTNVGDNGDPFPGTANNRSFTWLTDPDSTSWYSSGPSCIAVTNISDSAATMTADLRVTCPNVYLPLVMRDYASLSPLLNGDFESGHFGWTEFSTHGWDLITTTLPSPVTPHSGSWAVWLAGDYNETSTLSQSVTVPTGSPYLGFWHWIGSVESDCVSDYGYVRVNSTPVDTLALCSANNMSGWAHRVVNLSAYSGLTVTLEIQAVADGAENSNWFIDDVAFQASPSSLESGARLAPVPGDWIPRIAAGKEATWRPAPAGK